ncbi:MAG: Lrp/AsnC family transcriptional regulator [Nanoarchaeota archaeon]|nr:Lrp/AsnC family transcriptional regulator [Nanoarchaeota archaeon]
MIDKKDIKILNCLKENAKLSTQQISKKILIPITTVHHRIKKLEKEGIIKSYTALLDNKKLGKELAAYILITVDYKLLKAMKISQHELAKKIRMHELVEETAMVTGGTDIIIKIMVKDIDEMDEFVTKYLRNIEGVEKTQTMVILHEF